MAEEKWFVALEGAQIEGEHDAEKVRQLMARNPGKPLVVWNERMADWADPATLPAFKAAAAPRPAAPPSGGARGTAAAAAQGAAAAVQEALPGIASTFRDDVPLLKGLLDFRFETFVTPKVVRVLYILCVLGVAIGLVAMVVSAVMMIVSGLGAFGSGRMMILGLVYLVLSPILAAIQLTLARIFLEVVLVLFTIKESLVSQAGRKG